jgi:hypothetical protein
MASKKMSLLAAIRNVRRGSKYCMRLHKGKTITHICWLPKGHKVAHKCACGLRW